MNCSRATGEGHLSFFFFGGGGGGVAKKYFMSAKTPDPSGVRTYDLKESNLTS